jgi:2-methylisocitrate lyase-like PEP mutase family enzyme
MRGESLASASLIDAGRAGSAQRMGAEALYCGVADASWFGAERDETR